MIQTGARAIGVALRPLSGATMPPMSRPNYRWELLSALFIPLALACVESGVIEVVAAKAFGAGALAIAAVAAAPHAAALSSLLWTKVIHGRDRVRVVVATMLGLIACVAAIGLLPLDAVGLALLVPLAVLARCFYVGVLNARTDLWRGNYEREARARAGGAFTIAMVTVLTIATLAFGTIMDRAGEGAPGVFRAFYLGAAALALVGAFAYGRIRWRGRAETLAAERAEGDRKATSVLGMVRVMREDALYRRFMIAQFVMGIANLACMAPFVAAIDREFELGYTMALALTAIVPRALMVASVPLWSRMLGRMHIVDFRSIHAWTFALGNAMMGVGVLLGSIPLLFVSRAVVGFGMGGGTLAWNLGHHDFAPRARAPLYMGVHVVLTGVRGAIAPFLGALLYAGWSLRVGGTEIAFDGVGGWAFVLFGALGAAGALMFVAMRDDVDRSRTGEG